MGKPVQLPGRRLHLMSLITTNLGEERMPTLTRITAIAVLLLISTSLFADQITMKGGDRLSGTIVKSDGKTLVIKTDYAGDVTVNWPAIEQITSVKPLHVGLKTGQTIAGPVTTSNGNLEVQLPNQPPVTVARDAVTFIRGEEEEAAYEKSLHPGLLHGWVAGANVSFAVTRGNSETKNLALAFTATRKTLHDQLSAYANSVFATNDAVGAVPSTTADAVQGGARYDRNFDARLFTFGGADFQSDALQSLDLRSVFSSGIGFHAIKSDRTTLDLLAGANYTRENYTTLHRNLIALTVGEELTKMLGASTVVTQKLYAYPDLNEAGQYRATFNFGTVTKLNKWLGWQNAFGDIYVTNPPEGKKQNDILLTTGLNISFTR
jgi:putative salt-induced outer membrane protein YdiY